MTDTKKSAEQIRREMAHIRHEIDDDINGIVSNAKVMSDWTYYVKSYPLLTTAAAVALGYMVVPSRTHVISPSAKELEKLAAKNKLVVKKNPQPQKQGGIAGALFTLVATTLTRGLISYAGNKVGKATGFSAAGNEQATSRTASASPASHPPAGPHNH